MVATTHPFIEGCGCDQPHPSVAKRFLCGSDVSGIKYYSTMCRSIEMSDDSKELVKWVVTFIFIGIGAFFAIATAAGF